MDAEERRRWRARLEGHIGGLVSSSQEKRAVDAEKSRYDDIQQRVLFPLFEDVDATLGTKYHRAGWHSEVESSFLHQGSRVVPRIALSLTPHGRKRQSFEVRFDPPTKQAAVRDSTAMEEQETVSLDELTPEWAQDRLLTFIRRSSAGTGRGS